MIALKLRVSVEIDDAESSPLLQRPSLSLAEAQRLMRWNHYTLKSKMESGEVQFYHEGSRVKIVTSSLADYIKRKVKERIESPDFKVA